MRNKNASTNATTIDSIVSRIALADSKPNARGAASGWASTRCGDTRLAAAAPDGRDRSVDVFFLAISTALHRVPLALPAPSVAFVRATLAKPVAHGGKN